MGSPGTWRRLKIAWEIREGRQIPKALPEAELRRLAGLLLGIDEGRGPAVVASDALQDELGATPAVSDLTPLILDLARRVDVRPFL